MASVWLGTLLRFFVPGGFLWLGAVLAVRQGLNETLPPAVLHLAPYIVAGGGIILGWRFNRSKLVFALLALFTVDRLLAMPLGAGHTIVIQAAGVLLPLNFAYYALMTERGFVTGRGLFRLILFGMQPIICAGLFLWRPATLRGWLTAPLLKLPVAIPLPATDAMLCAFSLGFLFILLFYVRRRSPMDNAFLWAVASVFMALATTQTPAAVSFFLTCGGLLLIIGVIETAHTMAFRDELTGLPGRRALEEAMLKLGGRYAVAMVDIDFFKKFNDTYGHDIGDQVLRMVAGKLAQVGGGGKAFRYGGEEFTILFNGKEPEEAVPHLEQLRKTVETSGFSLRGNKRTRNGRKKRGTADNSRKVSVTVSMGVAGRPVTRQSGPQQAVKAADKALYQAKKAGRNRVVAG